MVPRGFEKPARPAQPEPEQCGLMPTRTVHLHLTRRCNLACAHCYSSSSPRATDSVEAGVALAALERLRAEGYETLALSGGEPLLHPEVDTIAREARSLGYRTSLITNGVLLTPDRVETLARWIDVTAVSFDGAPHHHDRVRRRRGAFARAVRSLGALRAAGVPFALSCTVSRGRLEDVVDLYELAASEGARALQVSPIVAVGRGADAANELALGEGEKARLALMARILDDDPHGPPVRAELQAREHLDAARAQFAILDEASAARPLGDLVNPLVVTETGRLQPFAYGLDPSHDVGRLGRGRLGDTIRRWRGAPRRRLARLVERSFTAPSVRAQAFIEWYADLVALSFEASSETARLPLAATA